MGQVKKWQKVTIGILVAALIAVVASIITRNVDTTAANNQAGYTEQAETQTRDYDAELAEEVTVPETSQAQKVPTANEIANELYKVFEKNYGKAYQKSSANEFYNTHYDVDGATVHIIPFHVWYQDGKMYANCYVLNTNNRPVTNINVNDLRLFNAAGELIAEDSFGTIKNLTLDPGHYVTQGFIFENGSFANSDLTNGVQFDAQTSWDWV